jgi:hypothetical protein
MAKRRSEEREAWWRTQVERQRRSGLSVRNFCEAGNLSEASFYAWRRRLPNRAAAARQPEFLPLMISAAAPASAGITIELRGGRVVRLPETMATEQIVAVLRGLEASEGSP